MTDVTQGDRIAAADLLDEISSLLDHVGIGQVADLIRDGEYDEHDATIAFARHRQATASSLAAENARLREAGALAADMLDMMLECWVQDRVISDEEGRQATGALMDLNAALKGE